MEFDSKIVKFGKERKIIEVPKAVRSLFIIGTKVRVKEKEK